MAVAGLLVTLNSGDFGEETLVWSSGDLSPGLLDVTVNLGELTLTSYPLLPNFAYDGKGGLPPIRFCVYCDGLLESRLEVDYCFE